MEHTREAWNANATGECARRSSRTLVVYRTVVEAWKFTESFDASRLERLNGVATFDDVVKAIQGSLEVIGGWVCLATDLGPGDCWRPIVAVEVESSAFDAFFNSPVGYRAQFLLSPERGQAANSVLLR